jgi:alkanesulfonate monooxygenase SsuD/methylene tetrahydromethanopterin reductase-like flavin-dependent oxidoreductase (luciferase family)
MSRRLRSAWGSWRVVRPTRQTFGVGDEHALAIQPNPGADHPYQRSFLDAWTQLSAIAVRTQNLSVFPDVASLPLRPPAVLAKAAASLDLLTGGRVELGLGAGAFWDAIEAMGGPRRGPGDSVTALREAIAVTKLMRSGERSIQFDGDFYRVKGVHPGPVPAHPIGVWVGAYKPRMLRLVGESGDGWLPSLGYLDVDGIRPPMRLSTVPPSGLAVIRRTFAVC